MDLSVFRDTEKYEIKKQAFSRPLWAVCILRTYPASFCDDGDGASCLNTVRDGSARRASLEQEANHS
jgi:hypothetical protein